MTKARENGDGGLVLIGTANPSAASSTSFTNLVVGKRYRVVSSLVGSTSNTLYFRFREGSTDKTASYYGAAPYAQFNSVTGVVYFNNTAYADLSTLGTYRHFATLDVAVISLTTGVAIGEYYQFSEDRRGYVGFRNDGMTNFNGFTLYPTSGTFTGQIKLYEYR